MDRSFHNGVGATGLSVLVVGCSGPSLGEYTYDAEPDEVTVHIEPGTTPGTKLVSYAAYWAQGAQAVTGVFAYESN